MTIDHRTGSADPRIEANVDAVLPFYRLFESGDSMLDAILATDWTVHPPAPGAPQGIEGYRPALAAFRAAFPDCAVIIEDAFGAGDRVVVRSIMRATHLGPFLNVPPTHKTIELRTCDIHRLSAERIVQSWHIEDFLGFLAQVGALG